MEIRVTVMPNAREAAVLRIDDLNYRVRVNAKPIGGKANERLVEILAEHFRVPKSRIRIIRGLTSRNKIVQVQTG